MYTVWEDTGLFSYVYRNDTLLHRTEEQLDVNYELHFHTDTEGELFVYTLRSTQELGENEKRLFSSVYQFVLDKEKEVITRKHSVSGTLDELTYQWDGKNLILDGEPMKKVH